MINVLNIVKSRFIKGENLPKWYEERLSICSKCLLNSKNIETKDKSVGRKSWELIAGAHCTDPSCGCTITEKSKIETEFCPKNKWIAVKDSFFDKLNIVSDSNKAILTFDDKSNRYVIDYGLIPYQFDSSFKLIIEEENISNLAISTSCGCTTAKPENTDKGIEIIVKYDTLRVGKFSKTIKLNYLDKENRKQTIINIKGQVKNIK